MLTKTPIDISFSQGLDTKTDSRRVPAGKFTQLENSVFTKAGLLTKRNGFGSLTVLPNNSSLFLTTFNSNLTAVGDSIYAYIQGNNQWVTKGNILPLDLTTLPLIRNNANQVQCDSAVSDVNTVCTVYTEVVDGSVSYKYVIADSITGQNIISPTAIPVSSGTVIQSPRVFILGTFFIIVFTNEISATYHLQYIAVSITNPTSVRPNADIASSYIPSGTVSWDGVVVGNKLFIAYNTTAGGQAIRTTFLDTTFSVATPNTFAGQIATMMSMSVDLANPSAPQIYAAYYDASGQTGYYLVVNSNNQTALTPTQWINGVAIANVTSSVNNQLATIFYEVVNTYAYDTSISTNYVEYAHVTQSGSVAGYAIVRRSVGLASKAFTINDVPYVLTIYSGPPSETVAPVATQPTYFLVDYNGNIVAKLAYSNGGNYLTLGLPSVTVTNDVAQVPYLLKDLIQAVNKATGAPNTAAIYTQTGISLCSFSFNVSTLLTAEIGNNLNISGGYIYAYDGYLPVEQGFHLWPDNVETATSTSGGFLTAHQYFYQVTYEWSDNQGNIFRSAPSIPVGQVTTGSTSSNTIYVPTLRMTEKTANPVKIVIYRWSDANQVYYQVTSIANPILNNLSVDYITFVDTLADNSIIGNNILYTTGGVLEDIGGPAACNLTLFNDRLFFINSEDRNLLGYSKQVIEATPVEISDLLTIYVAPSIGVTGSTGVMTALSAMDDKLIIFKKEAIYYINGSGPDNTGANSQYSDPIFITAVVGCTNQNSIVFIPQGLLFQSDKGIWLLGRDLSTSYLGAPVESYTANGKVLSSLSVPGTTQVRFTLDNGITLMYDYYYAQWGSFSNIPAISSTLYEGLHTYLNKYGQVFQETQGVYLDNSTPVLMNFTTGWINLAGFQGYERFYFAFLNGEYLTPFNLYCSFAYDFNPSPSQQVRIIPDNVPSTWGTDPVWGSSTPWGGPPFVFDARVFPEVQKCQSFQVTIQEQYDPSFGVTAGAGLTLSGMSLIVGTKRGFRTQSAGKSYG